MLKKNFHITLLFTSLLLISCEEEATRPKPTKKPDGVRSSKDLSKERIPIPEESTLPGVRTEGRDLTLDNGETDTRVFASEDQGQHSGGSEGGGGGSMDSGGGGPAIYEEAMAEALRMIRSITHVETKDSNLNEFFVQNRNNIIYEIENSPILPARIINNQIVAKNTTDVDEIVCGEIEPTDLACTYYRTKAPIFVIKERLLRIKNEFIIGNVFHEVAHHITSKYQNDHQFLAKLGQAIVSTYNKLGLLGTEYKITTAKILSSGLHSYAISGLSVLFAKENKKACYGITIKLEFGGNTTGKSLLINPIVYLVDTNSACYTVLGTDSKITNRQKVPIKSAIKLGFKEEKISLLGSLIPNRIPLYYKDKRVGMLSEDNQRHFELIKELKQSLAGFDIGRGEYSANLDSIRIDLCMDEYSEVCKVHLDKYDNFYLTLK